MNKLSQLGVLACFALVVCYASGAPFTMDGDFTDSGENFTNGTVEIQVSEESEDGKSELVTWAKADIVDGKFTIGTTITETTSAYVWLRWGENKQEYSQVILEAGNDYTIHYFGSYRGIAVDGEGLHGQLIAAWQMDEEYRAAMDGMGAYRQKRNAEYEARQAAAEEETVAEETVAEETVAEEREPSEHAEVLDWDSMECADYRGEFIGVLDREYEYTPEQEEYNSHSKTASEVMSRVLNEAFTNSEDFDTRMMAMQMGAFRSDREETLAAWKELAAEADEETVASDITPTIERLERSVQTAQNDDLLVPGAFSPGFKLTSLSGEEVDLDSVLKQNEIVLVDFWASWCGPCRAQFPALTEMYSEFTDKGFEIVGVSVDSTQEDWLEASEEEEIPWINLGEINEDGWGPISQSFGVQFIPKGYILDEEGCIVKKDLNTDELMDFLNARLEEG